MWPVLPDSDIGLTDCLRSNLYLICLRYNFKCKMLYPFDITNSHGRKTWSKMWRTSRGLIPGIG